MSTACGSGFNNISVDESDFAVNFGNKQYNCCGTGQFEAVCMNLIEICRDSLLDREGGKVSKDVEKILIS